MITNKDPRIVMSGGRPTIKSIADADAMLRADHKCFTVKANNGTFLARRGGPIQHPKFKEGFEILGEIIPELVLTDQAYADLQEAMRTGKDCGEIKVVPGMPLTNSVQ